MDIKCHTAYEAMSVLSALNKCYSVIIIIILDSNLFNQHYCHMVSDSADHMLAYIKFVLYIHTHCFFFIDRPANVQKTDEISVIQRGGKKKKKE